MADLKHGFADLEQFEVLVIGSLVADISCLHAPFDPESKDPKQGSSNPAKITQSVGGVAHNIALAANYIGASVLLTSVVGSDPAGNFLIAELEKEGLATGGIITIESPKGSDDVRTGQYVGNYDAEKNLIFGMADVGLMLHHSLEDESLWKALVAKVEPILVVLDTTFSHSVIKMVTQSAKACSAMTVLEPVSVPRASNLFGADKLIDADDAWPRHIIDTCTPNTQELNAMFESATDAEIFSSSGWKTLLGSIAQDEDLVPKIKEKCDSHFTAESQLAQSALHAICLLPFIPTIMTTLGGEGCLLALLEHSYMFDEWPTVEDPSLRIILEDTGLSIYVRHFAAPDELAAADIASVNGAGDSLLGAVIAGLSAGEAVGNVQTLNRDAWMALVDLGQQAALLTLEHPGTVSPKLRRLTNYCNLIGKSITIDRGLTRVRSQQKQIDAYIQEHGLQQPETGPVPEQDLEKVASGEGTSEAHQDVQQSIKDNTKEDVEEHDEGAKETIEDGQDAPSAETVTPDAKTETTEIQEGNNADEQQEDKETIAEENQNKEGPEGGNAEAEPAAAESEKKSENTDDKPLGEVEAENKKPETDDGEAKAETDNALAEPTTEAKEGVSQKPEEEARNEANETGADVADDTIVKEQEKLETATLTKTMSEDTKLEGDRRDLKHRPKKKLRRKKVDRRPKEDSQDDM